MLPRNINQAREIEVNRVAVYLIFALLILATQLGSLTKEVIDWDESTFILMAADVLDGNLPYLVLFDNKPPIMFLALGAAMAAFGESLVIVRLFGDACLFGICIATFAIARRIDGFVGSGLAVAVMIGASAVPAFQHTQTEHLAMVMVMVTLWLVISHREHLWSAALAGVLLSLATLTRTNLAFLVIALGIYYVAALFRPKHRVHQFSIFAFALAGLIPLGVLVAVYASAGELDTLWLCIVEVPMAYASDQIGPISSLSHHLLRWLSKIRQYPGIYGSLSLLILAGGIAYIRQLMRVPTAATVEGREDRLVILLLFGATFVSVLVSGAAYPHYWNQLLPFATIFIATAFSAVTYRWFVIAGLSAMVVLFALVRFVPPSVQVLTDWQEVKRTHHIHRAADLIAADRQAGDVVWALENHLVYWYLGDPPASVVMTHPSNITRAPIIDTLVAGGYVASDELDRLFSSRPRYLVTHNQKIPFYFESANAERYQKFELDHYSLWQLIGPVSVFRRKTD